MSETAVFEPLPEGARMDAYYYSFDRTGVGPVDAILSAVAIAGKGSHHTDGWQDTTYAPFGYYKGRPGLPDADTAADLIQRTANQSAERIRAVLPNSTEPQRVQPSREDVEAKLFELFDLGTSPNAHREADAILALFAAQPTVAEVREETISYFEDIYFGGSLETRTWVASRVRKHYGLPPREADHG